MNELKEGVWIAQGSENNILIAVSGKAPLLQIYAAINLNTFVKGKVEPLTSCSVEIQDILLHPEKYVIREAAITPAIFNSAGEYSHATKQPVESTAEIDNYVYETFKSFLYTNNNNRNIAKNRTACQIKLKLGFNVSQAISLVNDVLKRKGFPIMYKR